MPFIFYTYQDSKDWRHNLLLKEGPQAPDVDETLFAAA